MSEIITWCHRDTPIAHIWMGGMRLFATPNTNACAGLGASGAAPAAPVQFEAGPPPHSPDVSSR
jgi:hypothetical protein